MTDFLLHMFHEATKWDKGSTQSDKTRGRHTYDSVYGRIRKEIDGVASAANILPSYAVFDKVVDRMVKAL